MKSKKIISIDDLKQKLKKQNKTISLVHGVFDVFHIGHKRHFEIAKSLSDILVVSLTIDKFVNKGPSRPIFNQNLRSELVSSLEVVDFVVFSNHENAVNIINQIKPKYYVKGQDYKDFKKDVTKNIYLEKKAVEKNNGKIFFTEDIQFSSSNLINNYIKSDLSLVELNKYKLNKSSFKESCINQLKKISSLNIAIIGEIIFDEYIFSEEMEKPSKENIHAVKYKDKEIYLGGAAAIARNLSEFCKSIDLYSAGNFDKEYIKILSSIKNDKNIKINITDKKFQSIKKTRVLNHLNRKLFEIYYKNGDTHLNDDKKLLKIINQKFKSYDVVIIADFGHGFFNKKIYETIKKNSKFLTINTQTNSDNRGFNLITKYNKANFICLDQPELRLALSDKKSSMEVLTTKLKNKINFKTLVITLGEKGVFVRNNQKNTNFKTFRLNAFELNPTDTIGAGDAVFGVTSLLSSTNADTRVIGFIGNIFGALAAKILGHSENIKKNQVIKSIQYSLK